MSKVTVILPIHEFGENTKKYLDLAVQSVLMQVGSNPSLLIVYTHRAEEGGLLAYLAEKNFGEKVTTIKNEEKTDFCGQVNFGVKNSTTDFFSVLEFDDEYSTFYFRNVDKYIDGLTDVSLFLPITIDVDDKNNSPLQLVNQNIWSKGYVGENGVLGYLNAKSLGDFSYYTLGGAIFKKSDFVAVGGLKSNIVLSFTYEFILRFLNNGNKIYTIPKFGYKHVINRDGSLFMGLGAVLTNDDRRFWFETAKKESHFFADRVIDTTRKASLVETVAE
jgi:hypothetical protein